MSYAGYGVIDLHTELPLSKVWKPQGAKTWASLWGSRDVEGCHPERYNEGSCQPLQYWSKTSGKTCTRSHGPLGILTSVDALAVRGGCGVQYLEGTIRNLRYRLEHGTGYSKKAKAVMGAKLASYLRSLAAAPVQGRRLYRGPPEGCAEWSGVCKDSHVYNTIDGSRCPMSEWTREEMTRTTYMCPEWEKSFMDRLQKMPPWAWAVGGGLVVYLLGRR